MTGASSTPVVSTATGAVRGVRTGATSAILGVPYAEGERFGPPRPAAPWSGVRSADRFGSVFPSVLGGASAEDSWYANVWTPDVGGRLPVLVYVHGGGWQLGAGSLSTYDGSRLAERGGLVVVTFNYRLGPFGFGLHDDLVDPETGLAANWGLQDQVALLRWVRVHAAAFGGDPDNITLAGTSAGGASAHQLALRAEVRPLIRRIVTISAAHVRTPVMALTPEDSHAAYSRVARELGTSVPRWLGCGVRPVRLCSLLGTGCSSGIRVVGCSTVDGSTGDRWWTG